MSATKKNCNTENIRIDFALLVLMTVVFLFSFATSSYAITITGSETITTNSSSQYTATGCNGTISWSVTGTGTGISSSGVLTTTSASCGGITVTARCSDGSTATKTARVTNAGQWVLYSSCGFDMGCASTGCYNGYVYVSGISGNTRYAEYWMYYCKPAGGTCVTTSSGCAMFTPPPSSPTCPSEYYTIFAGTCGYKSQIEKWQCPSCTNGQTISCYTGAEETKNKGECKAGTQTCVNGQWGACVGEVLPQAEICGDGKDNNCDGNVDEGCETCEVSVKVSPSTVWPLIPQPQRPSGYKEDWTKADVVVTLSKPAPPEGCTVNLKIEPEAYSGGHSHNGNRPKGTVTPDSISFFQGEIGAQSAKYKSTEVAGEEKIKAKVNDKDTSETIIQIKVPGFVELGAGDGYVLIGQTSTHRGNHYGAPNTLYSLLDIADVYYETEKSTLRINDISLEWGGAFDLCEKWDPSKTCTKYPKGGHKTHRVGKTMDVSNKTTEGKVVTEKTLIKIIDDLDINVTILNEGNHFHLTFP